MKKWIFPALVVITVSACSEQHKTATNSSYALAEFNENVNNMSFYDFSFKTLDGQDFSFSSLKGKRVLIINTASRCGYTSQYKQLQELYDKFGGDKFTIVGFPANNFGGQEPGTNEQIASFCEKNYGVTFPMMQKISVKGSDAHPLYQWLTSKSMNGVSDGNVKWNFHKFLIDENGNWLAEYGSSTSPLNEKIIDFASVK